MKIHFLLLLSIFLTTLPADATDNPGYPVEAFLGATAIGNARISPDGRRIAFTTSRNDFGQDRMENSIWQLDLDASGQKEKLTKLASGQETNFNFQWSPDNRYLSFLSTRGSSGTPQLFIHESGSAEASQVTDAKQFRRGVGSYTWLPDGRIICTARESLHADIERSRREYWGDVIRHGTDTPLTRFYRLDISDSKKPKVEELAAVESNVGEFSVSSDGRQLAYVSSPPSSFIDSYKHWEVFILPVGNSGSPRQVTRNLIVESSISWSPDGKYLYMSSNGDVGGPTPKITSAQQRLCRIPISEGRTACFGPPNGGTVSEYEPLPDGSLLVLAVESTSVKAYRIDPSTGRALGNTRSRGNRNSLSVSSDGKRFVFVKTDNKSFTELYVANGVGELDAGTQLTDFNAELNAKVAPEVETVEWQNGEGDTVQGVLFWPPGRRGATKLPLVVSVHGGPSLADLEQLSGGWGSYGALLASRGYLVLLPNYRGSVGRGDEFMQKIAGHGCSRPTTDIIKGADHLVAQGWADPARMGIMGYSYGGVLTNCAIAYTSRFRVAVSGASVWNYISRFGTSDNFTTYDYLNLGKAPWEDFRRVWEESAISRAANIKTPTLIVHGGADRRVSTTQSYELYRALTRLGVPSELLVFPGEDHLFSKPSHKLTKVRAELAWLDHYLLAKPLPEAVWVAPR